MLFRAQLLNLFAFLVLINGLLLVSGAGGVFEQASKLRRTQSLNSLDDRLNPAKANKVSALLHFLHRKSKESVMQSGAAPIEEQTPENLEKERKKYENKTDREILTMFCPVRMNSLCVKAVDFGLSKRPADMSEIANSIRNKPPTMDGNKLIYHKIFETAIREVEQRNYDQKLDKIVDAAVARNAYLGPASKAITLGMKFAPAMA